MTWHFTPHSHKAADPVDNDGEPLLVVPNDRGGFSLRFADSVTLIGHYPSADAAATYAKTQCQHVRVIIQNTSSQPIQRSSSLLEAKGTTLIRS